MMRSLFSGVAGLKVHQTKMDVIGNNISNVNTIGFKSSTVNFSDVFYQTLQGASGPNAATGAAGTNAMQIGLGSNLASITTNITGTGGTQRTDRNLDLMINGDAFFAVQLAGETYFTKSGALNVDPAGMLYCTSNGANILGWQADADGNIMRDTVSPLKVLSPDKMFVPAIETTKATLSGNIASKSTDVAFDPEKDGYAVNVNFYDRLGNSNVASINIMQTEDNPNQYTASIGDIMDSTGKSILYTVKDENGIKKYESTDQYISFDGEEYEYTVDEDTGVIEWEGGVKPSVPLIFSGGSGDFISVGQAAGKSLNISLNDGDPDNPFPNAGIDIDFSNLTMASSGSNVTTIESNKGDIDGKGAGSTAGQLSGFTIQTDGKIIGIYDNDAKKCFGQIVLATFPNPSGLESVGNSLYRATLNSGEFDGIGVDPSTVKGLSTGALEMSNVDLSTEFTSMITTQRGFQANSRIITTSDSMLEELVNLKR